MRFLRFRHLFFLLALPCMVWGQESTNTRANWNKAEACGANFLLPSNLTRVEGVTGIDNCAAIFESDALSVTIDTRSFSFSPSPKYSLDSFDDLAKKPDFKRVKTMIAGRKAVIVTFDEPEDAKAFKYSSLVSIAAVDGFRIHVALKNAEDRNIAEQIFRSVRFVH